MIRSTATRASPPCKETRAGLSGFKTSHLPALMRLGSDKAWPVVWGLASAWPFAGADCLQLIESHWLDDEANDSLVFSTLRQLKDWDEEALKFACRIVARTEIDSSYVMWLATTISESRPELAPTLVATHLNAQLKKLEAAEDPPPDPLPENATEEDRIVQQWAYRPKERFDRLLEGNTDLHNLPSIAEAAPKAFLDGLWPWFLKALEYSLDEPHHILPTTALVTASVAFWIERAVVTARCWTLWIRRFVAWQRRRPSRTCRSSSNGRTSTPFWFSGFFVAGSSR